MLGYFISLVIITAIWTLFAQSYNLSFGLGGLLNLGHIIFFGVGAYTAAILDYQFGWGLAPGVLLGGCMAAVLAVGFGISTLRLAGHYLAVATLGAAFIAQAVATNWFDLTRGPLGIPMKTTFYIGDGAIIPDTPLYLLIILLIVAACLGILWLLFRSPFGRALRALQDDEIALQAVGKNTFLLKIEALVLSAFFAGVAGGLVAHYRLFVSPTVFMLRDTILLLSIVVIGGRGKFWGVIGGTILMTMIIGELPRFVGFPDAMIGPARNLLYAGMLLVAIYLRPEGIFVGGSGQIRRIFHFLRRS